MEFREDRKTIQGYEGIYEVTHSGRIISIREKRALTRCNDEYGFHIVKLYKNGESNNHYVFELWEKEFPRLHINEFKGARKTKYGTGCKLIKK
ncbi:NUMOD4 domain-containing protein [Paenisporosarcina quisquiliarum]|uniref:NUMOD4 domain-containing protein n=1 Tax=Paenisporosarcina quisquiliarum TaxID=365346 RepID=UPI00373545B9